MAQLYYDNFERADSTAFDALGSGWMLIDGPGGLSNYWFILESGKAVATSDPCSMRYSGGSLPPNIQWSAITVSNPADNGVGASVRMSARREVNSQYTFTRDNANLNCLKIVDDSYSSLYNDVNTVVGGDVIYVQASGTQILGKLNGTQIFSATDSALSTGYVGIWGADNPGLRPSIEAWSGGDFSPASGGGGSGTLQEGSFFINGVGNIRINSATTKVGALLLNTNDHISTLGSSLSRGTILIEGKSDLSISIGRSVYGSHVFSTNSHIQTNFSSAKSSPFELAGEADINRLGPAVVKNSPFQIAGEGDINQRAQRTIAGSVETGDLVTVDSLASVDKLAVFELQSLGSTEPFLVGVTKLGSIITPSTSDIYFISTSVSSDFGAFELLSTSHLGFGAAVTRDGRILFDSNSDIRFLGQRNIVVGLALGGTSQLGLLSSVGRNSNLVLETIGHINNAAGAVSKLGAFLDSTNSDIYFTANPVFYEYANYELGSNSDFSIIAAVAKGAEFRRDGQSDLYFSSLSNVAENGVFELFSTANLAMSAAVNSVGSWSLGSNTSFLGTSAIGRGGFWNLNTNTDSSIAAAVNRGAIILPDGRSDIYFSNLTAVSELGGFELFTTSRFDIAAAVVRGATILGEGNSNGTFLGSAVLTGRIIDIGGNSYILFSDESSASPYPAFVPLKIVYLTLRV